MSDESVEVSGDSRTRGSRRRLLATAGAGILGSLAGCGVLGDDANAIALESSSCPEETTARTPLERGLLPVSGEEFSEPILWYTSLDPSLLRRYASFASYLRAVELVTGNLGLSLANVGRATTLRPPVHGFPAHVSLETDVDPEITRLRVGNRHYADPVDEIGDFDVYASRTPALERFALAEGRVIVAPGRTAGDLSLSSRERVDRLLALEGGDRQPYTCFHPSLEALFRRLEQTTLVNVVFRTDDAAFDDGHPHVPAGALAGAYAAEFDVPPGYFEDDRDDGYPVHLAYVAVFPNGEGDEAATIEHVRTARMREGSTGESPVVGFEDPAVDRDGRVVAVTETIGLE